ncbi:uncharacterized protein [Triticum aestivum]|uniref:uncharacterized protein isoform X1 n=1 Tax=Triticum aestivum TaxID=4565 RepID=UPI001D0163F2|nr:uncharacterized protein LOC123122241 isoform X1 [Triticum aestivum]
MNSSQRKRYRDRDRYLQMTPYQREAYLQRNREYKRMRRECSASCSNTQPTPQQKTTRANKNICMTGKEVVASSNYEKHDSVFTQLGPSSKGKQVADVGGSGTSRPKAGTRFTISPSGIYLSSISSAIWRIYRDARFISPPEAIWRIYSFNLSEMSPPVLQLQVQFLPRIPLYPSEDDILPFKFKRKQFPIRLSFAMTINKAHGQTIPNVGIYLPEPVFSHGQLYVALSRGISRQTTRVLAKPNKDIDPSGKSTKNIVYRDVLV